MYDRGLKYYLKGDFVEALQIFKSIKDDPPSKIFTKRCTDLIKNPPEKWDGVISYSVK